MALHHGPLEILVVEDQEMHRISAKRLEELGHRITFATTANEAAYHLGFSRDTYFGSQDKHRYDVVLCDLEFPLGEPNYDNLDMCFLDSVSDEEYDLTKPEPLGYAIALAAAKIGVPHIGILTNKNHHGGPVHACLDLLYTLNNQGHVTRSIFTINASRLLICDLKDTQPYLYLTSQGEIVENSSTLSEELPMVKNWACLLEKLLM